MAFPRQIFGLMRALSFLTRIPMPDEAFAGGPRQTAEDAALFPLAGLVAALPGALVLLVVSSAAGSPLLAAALATVTTIIITGALHEDGLADVADGFGGGHSPERRLAIMKDSANGTFGTLALIVSVLLRVAALGALVQSGGALAAALVFLGVHGAARAAMVWHWQHLPLARPGGTADAAGTPEKAVRDQALLLGVLLFAIAGLPGFGPFAIIVALAVCIALTYGFARLCTSMIGGKTGDTIGAAEQIGEITLLVALAIAA